MLSRPLPTKTSSEMKSDWLHALRSTCFSAGQSAKARSSSLRSDGGATKDSSPEDESNPMTSTFPTKVTLFRCSQVLNALA